MSGGPENSEVRVLYRRERTTQGAATWTEPSAEGEVKPLLSSIEAAFGDYTLEVQTVERIRKMAFQKSFESKKQVLEARSESSDHWKYNELDSFKKEIRNKFLGTDRVLEKRVYVGLDSDKIAKGIAESGFASTKCRNNWFASGHYVTTHAWYAARYGMDEPYDDSGGILDPRCNLAVGKQGRLVVCCATMSNVYPITRSCAEDHAITSFSEATQQGKPWSKWYDEDSSKGKKMKDGFDTHFVRVKKADAGTFSNFQACQDDDVLNAEDIDIADELVILEEAQLLPEYCVYYCVRKVGTEGVVHRTEFPDTWECYSSPCSDHSSTTGSSNSRSSTIRALDSPRKVSVLLVFTKSEDQKYMFDKQDVLKRKGFTASVEVITDPVDLHQAVVEQEPSIVYIEGPSSGEWPWERFDEKRPLIEEIALLCCYGSQWRACVFNFGTAEQEILENVCDRHPGKLNLLSWAKRPVKKDMDYLWKMLFECYLGNLDCQLGEKEAFERALASLDNFGMLSATIVTAPSKHPSQTKEEKHFSFCSLMSTPFRCLRWTFDINSDKKTFDRVNRVMSSTVSDFRDASVEVKVHTDPDVEMKSKTINNGEIAEFEHKVLQILPDEVRGNGVGFRGPGCFRLRLDVQAFKWLCNRVDNSDEPLYLDLPMAWGGGEVRVKNVLPGETCWFEAVLRTNEVHPICNRIDDILKSIQSPTWFEELRVRTLAGRIVYSISKSEAGIYVQDLQEKISDTCGFSLGQVVLLLGSRELNSTEALQPILEPIGYVELLLVLHEKVAHKGITVGQLLHFCRHHKIEPSWKTEDVARDIVIPQTEGKKTCYMDSEFMMKHGGPQLAEKLVSHSWQSPFLNTVLNIVLDASGLCTSDIQAIGTNSVNGLDVGKALKEVGHDVLNRIYWLDIFAVNQHAKGSMSTRNRLDQLDDLVDSVQGLVVSVDRGLRPLRCPLVIAEISEAIKSKPIYFRFASGLENIWELMAGDLVIPSHAECDVTKNIDSIGGRDALNEYLLCTGRILNKIDSIGGRDALNEYLLCMVEVNFGILNRLQGIAGKPQEALGRLRHLDMFVPPWQQRVPHDKWASFANLGWGKGCDKIRNVEHFGISFRRCAPDLIEVPALFGQGLKEMKSLQHLQMDFSACNYLKDLSALGQGLKEMKSLQHLQMDFLGCSNLKDLSALGQGLKEMKSLQHLQINFRVCTALKDLSALGQGLIEMKTLQHLQMDFHSCTALKDVSDLGPGLIKMQTLQHLQMDFSGCSALKAIVALGQGLTEMKRLQHLQMNFCNCSALEDISALGQGFKEMRSLQHLDMVFGGCYAFRDLSALDQGLIEMKSLQHLHMNFSCTALKDITSLGHVLTEMKSLQHLHLDFVNCSSLEDITALGQGLSETTTVQHLQMDFRDCKALKAIAALGKGLIAMKSLQHLLMDFGNCTALKDISALGHGLKEMMSLHYLDMNFCGCSVLEVDISALVHALKETNSLQHLQMNFYHCMALTGMSSLGQGLKDMGSLRHFEIHLGYDRDISGVDADCQMLERNGWELDFTNVRLTGKRINDDSHS